MTRVRLNKFLSTATALSRRAADRAIVAGEIRINGKVVSALGTQVDPRSDRIEWQGQQLRALQERIYLAFYKPRHVLVTKSDPRGRATIWERLDAYRDVCDAVGRLDFESEGLLLITNDGTLIHHLTHPSREVPKTYHVKVRGIPTPETVAKLAAGMVLDKIRYKPEWVKLLRSTDHNGWLEMILHEGKYREIRQMCDAIGYPVLKLKRVAVGPVRLGDLKPGKTRKLRPKEITALRTNRPIR